MKLGYSNIHYTKQQKSLKVPVYFAKCNVCQDPISSIIIYKFQLDKNESNFINCIKCGIECEKRMLMMDDVANKQECVAH